ncbi:MAG: MraY family glycosyltransferase [Anaerolineales bacterium]
MSTTIALLLFSLTIFFTAVVVTSLIAQPFIRLARRLKIMDIPGSSAHKKHKNPTPKAGGLILVTALAIAWIAFGWAYSQEVLGILISALIIFVFGLIDDIKGMNVFGKFAGQLLAVAVMISFGVRVSAFSLAGTEVDEILNLVITIVWVVGITNAVNLVDSADSLAISLTLVTAFFLLLGAIIAGQEQLAFQATALLGICLVLIYFNLAPARLFLGDSGTQTIGFLLASLSILYNPVIQPQASSWFVPITFLAVPIFDVCLVFFSRLRRGIPFYQSDTNHTYHRLVARGLPPSRAVWLMDLAGATAGMIGLFALYQDPVLANAIFVGLLLLGLAAFFVLETMRAQ